MRVTRARRPAWAFALYFIVSATAALGQSVTGDAGTFVQRELIFDARPIRYMVYVPQLSSPNHALPILLYLHGAGAIGTNGTAQVASGLAAAIRSKPSRFPMIVVFPQATERWVTPRMERLALATLERSANAFHADPNRVYLAGYSVGAAGAWRLAYLHPDRFAAVVAVAGTVRSAPKLFRPGELAADIRGHAYLRAPDPFVALATRLRGIPIAVYQGSDDKIVSPVESRNVVSALRSLSSAVRFTEFPGVNHEGVLPKVLADPNLIPWLLAQSRTAMNEHRKRPRRASRQDG